MAAKEIALSDRLLRATEPTLARMLCHPFVEDICADRLSRAVLDRYLAYEGAFVETAISVFGFAVARAPDMAAKRHLIGVLDALANEQMPYFEARLAARGITPAKHLPDGAAGLRDGVSRIAQHGTYIEIVTAMFAAEWMYWTWSRRAADTRIADRDLRAWVDLHADDAFAAQALWLKHEIDRVGQPDQLNRLAEVFTRMTKLEIDFHHAPYEDCHVP